MDNTTGIVPYSTKIDWTTRFEDIKPAWYNRESVKKTVANTFLVLAGIAAFTTTLAAFTFTATPEVVMKTVSSLAITTLALTVIGIIGRIMAGYRKDIDKVYKEAWQAAYNDIVEKRMSFIQIDGKLRDHPLHFKKYLTKEDMNNLLSEDLKVNSSYEDFIERHGEGVLNILNDSNKALLKEKFLQSDWSFIDYERNGKSLGINQKEISERLKQEIKSLTYLEFEDKHSLRCIRGQDCIFFKESLEFTMLRSKLLTYLKGYEGDIKSAKPMLKLDCSALGITQEVLDECVIFNQLDQLIGKDENQKISYKQFREGNGVGSLKLVPDEFKRQVQNEFLRHIKTEKNGLCKVLQDYRKDIEFLQFDAHQPLNLMEHIREIIIPIQLTFKNQDYCNFRDNNGWDDIHEFLIYNPDGKHEAKEQLKNLFCELPYNEMKNGKYKSDRHVLGVNSKHICDVVWSDFADKPYEQWVAKHQGFLNELDEEGKKKVSVKFLKHLEAFEGGMTTVLKTYHQDIQFLQLEIGKIGEIIIPKQLDLLRGEKDSYVAFRANNGWENIQAFLELDSTNKEEAKKILKTCFCKLPYKQMMDSNYKSDRKVLDITEKEISSVVIGYLDRSGCSQFFQEHKGFIETLTNNKTLKNRVNLKFVPFLNSATSKNVLKYAYEANILGVSIKDILKDRWEKEKISSILANTEESDVFFDCLNEGMFEQKDWRNKVLEEIKSFLITYISKTYGLFLKAKIIEVSDLRGHVKSYLKGKSISDCSWREFFSEILKQGSWVADEEINLINTYDEKVEDAKQKFESLVKLINENYNTSVNEANNSKKKKKNNANEDVQLKQAKGKYQIAKDELCFINEQIKTRQTSIRNYEVDKQKTKNEAFEREKEINKYKNQIIELKNLSKDDDQKSKQLEQEINQINSQITDSEKEEVTGFFSAGAAIQKKKYQSDQLKLKEESLKEINSRPDQLKLIEKQLKELQNAPLKVSRSNEDIEKDISTLEQEIKKLTTDFKDQEKVVQQKKHVLDKFENTLNNTLKKIDEEYNKSVENADFQKKLDMNMKKIKLNEILSSINNEFHESLN